MRKLTLVLVVAGLGLVAATAASAARQNGWHMNPVSEHGRHMNPRISEYKFLQHR